MMVTESNECDCVEVCDRWVFSEDGLTAHYCPYVPGGGTDCKQLIYNNMQPNITKRKG